MFSKVLTAFTFFLLVFTGCEEPEPVAIIPKKKPLAPKAEAFADFDYPTGEFLPNEEIDFENLSKNVSGYLWDFGDSTVSTEVHPKHSFKKPGVYPIKLAAQGEEGETSVTKEIIIRAVDIPGEFQQSVILAIDTTLLPGINENFDLFIADLELSGYQVVIHKVKEETPFALRKSLQNYYALVSPKVEGVMFFGNVPLASASISSPDGQLPLAPSMQYYMDLDGNFSFEGRSVIDQIDSHTGKVEIEIWASILPYYQSQTSTIEYINDYLAKNHNYRVGEMKVQKGYITPLIGARISTEALYHYQYEILKDCYTDLRQRGNLFVGIDNTLGDTEKFPNARVCYEKEMLTDKYDVADIGGHGSNLAFGAIDESGSISIDIAYARTHEVKPIFLLDNSCSTVAIHIYPNLGTEFLYNKNNNVLVYTGATTWQGGMGWTVMGRPDNYTAGLLTQGKSIGVAHFASMTLPFTTFFHERREEFSAQQILLGDGTLKLQEYMSH
jgi:PKD repeat protein